MTAPGKSLVEWARGRVVAMTVNLDVPNWRPSRAHIEGARNDLNKAIAYIERLERERDSAAHVSAERLKRAEAAEAALTRLKAPLPNSRTTAEERVAIRTAAEADNTYEDNATVLRLLDDLDAYAAQARSAKKEAEEAQRVVFDLAAIVRAELPSLLDEDSGGNAQLDMAIDRVLASPATAQARSAVEPTHRHVRRGTEYVEIGRGELQSSITLREGDEPLVVYRSVDDGRIWIRPASEFDDGRFEAIHARRKGETGNG